MFAGRLLNLDEQVRAVEYGNLGIKGKKTFIYTPANINLENHYFFQVVTFTSSLEGLECYDGLRRGSNCFEHVQISNCQEYKPPNPCLGTILLAGMLAAGVTVIYRRRN